jgi:undecaprenyl-diphosphatase
MVVVGWLMYAATLLVLQQVGWLAQPPQWDRNLFGIINQPPLPGWMDSVAIAARYPWTWAPLYLCLIGWMFYRRIPRVWKILLTLVLAVILSDQISASLIKPWAMRLRPCRFPETALDCRLLVHCGSGFGFVSSHASNHFAVAWGLGLLFYNRWKATGLFLGTLWAGMVCWSQIRVGVHFPLDIVCGAVLGVLIAFTLWILFSPIKVPPPVSSGISSLHSTIP